MKSNLAYKPTGSARLYEHMTMDEYHSYSDIKKLGKDAVLSKSMLAAFDPCPAKFADEYIDGHREEDTGAMRIGSAVHMRALQPELFEETYYIMPLKKDGKEITRNKKHEAYQKQLYLADGRIDLQPSEMIDIDGMAASLKKNKKAMLLLDKPGVFEASIFWTDPQTGLKFRCRPDFMADDGLLVDLKATGRADNEGVKKISWDKRYDLSVALTARGYKALTGEMPQSYAFLFVETSRPYVIEAYPSFEKINYQNGKISKSYLEIGEERLSRVLDRYMECQRTGIWPGYNVGFMPMSAPDYAVRKLYETEGDY